MSTRHRAQRTITSRMWFLTGMLIFNLVAVSAVAAWNSQSLIAIIGFMGGRDLPALKITSSIMVGTAEIKGTAYRALVEAEYDAKNAANVRKRFDDTAVTVAADLAELARVSAFKPEGKEVIEVIQRTYADIHGKGVDVFQLVQAGERRKAAAVMSEFEKLDDQFELAMGQVVEAISHEANASSQEGASISGRSKVLSMRCSSAARSMVSLWQRG